MPTDHSRLLAVVLAAHVALAASVAALAYRSASSAAAGYVLAALAIAPLAATFRAIATHPPVRAWVALLLVVYVGAASVEVVASSGGAWLASLALLAAAFELGLLLTLIRRSRPRPRADRG